MKASAHQIRLFMEIDLVAFEIQELGVDDGEAGLPAGLGDGSGHQVPNQNDLHLIPADQASDFQILGIAKLSNHMVGAGTAAGALENRQQRLDRLDVWIVPFGRQHNDGPAGLHGNEVEIGHLDRAAAPADDASAACMAHFLADFVLHLDFVSFGQDDNA